MRRVRDTLNPVKEGETWRPRSRHLIPTPKVGALQRQSTVYSLIGPASPREDGNGDEPSVDCPRTGVPPTPGPFRRTNREEVQPEPLLRPLGTTRETCVGVSPSSFGFCTCSRRGSTLDRGPLSTEVHSRQGFTLDRGPLSTGVHSQQRFILDRGPFSAGLVRGLEPSRLEPYSSPVISHPYVPSVPPFSRGQDGAPSEGPTSPGMVTGSLCQVHRSRPYLCLLGPPVLPSRRSK